MSSKKKQWKQQLQRWLATNILKILILITGKTANIKRQNPEILDAAIKEYGSVIVATWHQNIYFSTWLLRKQSLTALISSSNDGEAIYRVLAHFGYKAVRGSSTRGGVSALKQLINILKKKESSVAITPDGPLGPPEKIQSGVILLAKYAGVPIIPWHYEASLQWNLKSWDKHKIPKPFTKIVESCGEPFMVPKNLATDDVASKCIELETVLKELAQQSKNDLQSLN